MRLFPKYPLSWSNEMSNTFFVHESSKVKNVQGESTAKIYKECKVVNSNLGENVTIGDYSRVFNSRFEENVALQRNAMVYSTEFGRYTYTGKNFTSWYGKIGAFCSISWNVSIGGANHDYNRVTTHSFLYSKDYGFFEDEPGYDRFNDDCIIGNDVWIAANACICRGVTVGDGAVIAAGAVVTHDVVPYTIVAGVPAKPIKKRFSDDIIKVLIKSRWWELPVDVIKDNFDLFNSIPTIEIAKKIYDLRK